MKILSSFRFLFILNLSMNDGIVRNPIKLKREQSRGRGGRERERERIPNPRSNREKRE